jgi:LuxR family maltose regulon positive regulatory protein
MAIPILTTKLHIPPARPDWVPRPRLIEQVNEGLQYKLTLVSAPAGFGKTTLLSDWSRQSPFPVAWLSLDAGDNDPARFWTYVIAAVQTVHSDTGMAALAAMQAPQPPPMESLLTGLINEIAGVLAPFVLVLDDLHLISGEPVHDGLTFLLDNLPSQLHLVVSSRADPPWPLARLRARREMVELRSRDLRFTSQEAVTFLKQVMKLNLSPEDVAALKERTEGWIVGLQMAALSMRGRDDLSGFVRAFSGSQRFVLDYLVEEVLERQPGDVQEFLLQTSILERMSAPLCDAVTGRDDSQTTLAQLEEANLFLVPLDDERRWYRYHHLFADLLRSRLQRAQPDQVPALHRRASEWYESQGQIVEAMGYALLAGDVGWIEHLVAGNALGIIYHGDLAVVTRWLDTLPAEVRRARPRLGVAQAWVLAYAGRLDDTEPLLQAAEKALAGPGEHNAPVLNLAERQQIAGHIAAVRAYVAALKEHLPQAAALAREALDRLPETDLIARGWVSLVLGCVLRSLGDLAAAAQTFAEALAISQAAGDSHLAVDVLWEWAGLQSVQGQLRSVVRTCQQALRMADQYTRQGGRPLPVTGYTYTLMSNVFTEWNDLETALRYARQGIELCKLWGQADALTQGYFNLAGALQAIGDTDGALEALQRAKEVVSTLGPWYTVTAGAHEAHLRLAQGDVAAAVRWLQECGPDVDDALNLDYSASHQVLARTLMAQGRLEEALELLARLYRMAEAAGAMRRTIRILVLQALAWQAQGEEDRALAALKHALSLAEPEGYVRTFVGEGAPLGKLLRQAAGRGIKLDYVGRLLAALENEATSGQQASRLAASSLLEPLSERELEVLRLLTTYLSSTEIAQELVVSASTVRSHIKNIYGKLDVHTRADAVRRARELGLV